ncbi:hypothetical protein Daus18300_000476 [Diaporthe australafricana]|uniref:Peptidase S8/S53 domain-containing protein n=1 Tax=Diaporthe australafricana TaxID=127596 RepID=A0ABR3Y4T7_9PEZI
MASNQERPQGSPTSSVPIRVPRASSFYQDGQEQWDFEGGSEENFSDPEDTRQPSPAITSTAQSLTIEQERANIWRDITEKGKSYDSLENFKAIYEERLRRCCGPDGKDKNKTILHWLPSHLWEDHVSPNHLEWLVSTIIAFNPLIICEQTNDTQKLNCLHVALEAKRVILVRLICEQSLKHSAESLLVRQTISQGNDHKENSLHMAIRQEEPDLSLIQFLVENADKNAISMQRLGRDLENETEDLNTPLHDLVHIDRVLEVGYMKVLAQMVKKCPEALKISNGAKETPFLFHVATRFKKNNNWAGLEFLKPNSSATQRSKKGAYPTAPEDTSQEMVKIAKVGSYLLDQCCSQFPYEEACICLYGDKKFEQNISFQPASPVDLRTGVAHDFLNFYPILSYVELTLVQPHGSFGIHTGTPGASLISTRQSAKDSWKRSESVKKIFEWLYDKKKVRRILKLVVIDDAALPCSDSTFEDCLQGFDIRYLNWNKEDLCIDTLRSAGLSNVKELWLSWSGRNSVLHSWSSKESGLPKLGQGIESDRDEVNFNNFKRRLQKNTSELQFDPYRQGMTKKITAALDDELKAARKKLKEQMLTWTGSPNYAVMARVRPEDPPPSLEATISLFDARINDYFKKMNNIREIKVNMSVPVAISEGKSPPFGEHREPGHKWIDAASRLATAVGKAAANNKDRTSGMRPIKVAIIDDGVTPGHLTRPSALQDGWPFSGPERKQSRPRPYYHSEKGHGTKMARLILLICPHASLYVAKVDMHKDSDASVASSAAEAIEWAIEKEVDIISMSWTIKRVKSGPFNNRNGITSLELAIQAAANKDTLMFCAVQDAAHYEPDESFPSYSDTTKLMIVGSADQNGEPSVFVRKDSANYLFPGEISLPTILDEKDKGSSVATAVAAGMAAMILWCDEYRRLGTKEAVTVTNKSVAKAGDHREPEYAGTTPSKVREPARSTAAEWNFRQDRRMNHLFNELKPSADDRFVDITNVIDEVLRETDEYHNDSQGTQAEVSCAETFIEKCRTSLRTKLR